MARDDHGDEARNDQRLVDTPGQRFLSGMGAGGQPARTVTQRTQQRGERHLVGRQRGGREFQIAETGGVRSTQGGEPPGILLGLAQAQHEAGQETADEAAHLQPAAKGARRDAAVQQHQRDLPPRRFDQQVRPEFRFDPQSEVGLPMIEEAPHPGHAIDRHELVDSASRQSIPHHRRRSDGAGGDQHGGALLQGRDHRQHRDRLADAGGVQPDQPAFRARQARLAQPLREADRILLPPRQAAVEICADQRPAQGGQQAVEAEDHDAAGSTGTCPIRRSADWVTAVSPSSMARRASSSCSGVALAGTRIGSPQTNTPLEKG